MKALYNHLKSLSPEAQAYYAAGVILFFQYTFSFIAYFELFPDIAGKSLNGATKNTSFVIPGIIAITGSLFYFGVDGIRHLLKPYKIIPFNPFWWVFAGGILIPILYISLYLNDIIYFRELGAHPFKVPTVEDLKYYTPLFVQVAISDELFWIGFIYPRLLAANYSPLKASLAIGILWGLDYVPFIFTEFLIAQGLNLPNLLLGWLSLTPIYIWLYHKTRSALIVIFFNVCMQFLFTAIPILPHDTGDNTGVAMANVVCIVTGFLLWTFWPKGKDYDLSFLTSPKTSVTNR